MQTAGEDHHDKRRGSETADRQELLLLFRQEQDIEELEAAGTMDKVWESMLEDHPEWVEQLKSQRLIDPVTDIEPPQKDSSDLTRLAVVRYQEADYYGVVTREIYSVRFNTTMWSDIVDAPLTYTHDVPVAYYDRDEAPHLVPEPGFTPEDAAVMDGIVRRLEDMKRTGPLSYLASDLASIDRPDGPIKAPVPFEGV